jgi:hypothetical protein
MTLSELDEKLAKEAKEKKVEMVVITPKPPKSNSSETHAEWMQRRAREDACLQFNKCPLCGCDTNLEIINDVRYYKCTGGGSHLFTRWTSLVIGPNLIREYTRDPDGSRHWES